MDWFALIALAGLWGCAFLVQKLALESFSPSLVASSRIILAAVVLCGAVRIFGARMPHGIRQWGHMAVVAALGTVFPFNLIAWGQQYIASAQAGVLMAATPLYVLTFAHFLVPGEHMTRHRVAGFLLGFIGVGFVIGPQALTFSSNPKQLAGMAAVLIAAVGYAASSIYTRRLVRGSPVAQAAAMMIIACAASLPVALIELPVVTLPVTGTAIVALLVLGVFSTGLGGVVYFHLIQTAGPTFLSIVSYLIPVWAVLAGVLFLGESLGNNLYFGLALILLGIAISEFGPQLVRAIAGQYSTPRGRDE